VEKMPVNRQTPPQHRLHRPRHFRIHRWLGVHDRGNNARRRLSRKRTLAHELGIAGAVNFARTTSTDGRKDFVPAKFSAYGQVIASSDLPSSSPTG
jgi:hypothetical protein